MKKSQTKDLPSDQLPLFDEVGEIVAAIDALEHAKAEHEKTAADIGQQLAAIRDRLNGRSRKARTGKFTRNG